MKVFIIGGGGRESALAWKIARSQLVEKVFAYPGNPGMEPDATIPDLPNDSLDTLRDFAAAENIDITVVGPEKYLAAGITDHFAHAGLDVFGPTAEAAQLESSKLFAKQIMREADIPTASYHAVESETEARALLDTITYPCVVKADGLAAGKGVIIARDRPEAEQAISDMFTGRFSSAGDRVIIEEFLDGEELSLLVITDGTSCRPLLFSQDHKPAFDGDTGPNTGGMGAYTPVSIGTHDLYTDLQNTILEPLLETLRRRNIEYRGVLYLGLIIVDGKPYVLEFNVRFGDPETEPLLFHMQSDIVPAVEGAARGTLSGVPDFTWYDGVSVCVVMASGGYPESYQKGYAITGLDTLPSHTAVFHAGTSRTPEGKLVTSGGRVLMVTSRGDTVEKAVQNTYSSVDQINFTGAFHRSDIARRECDRAET